MVRPLQRGTAALAWTNEVAVERFLPLVSPVTDRYWRICADAVPRNFGLDLAQFELAQAA